MLTKFVSAVFLVSIITGTQIQARPTGLPVRERTWLMFAHEALGKVKLPFRLYTTKEASGIFVDKPWGEYSQEQLGDALVEYTHRQSIPEGGRKYGLIEASLQRVKQLPDGKAMITLVATGIPQTYYGTPIFMKERKEYTYVPRFAVSFDLEFDPTAKSQEEFKRVGTPQYIQTSQRHEVRNALLSIGVNIGELKLGGADVFSVGEGLHGIQHDANFGNEKLLDNEYQAGLSVTGLRRARDGNSLSVGVRGLSWVHRDGGQSVPGIRRLLVEGNVIQTLGLSPSARVTSTKVTKTVKNPRCIRAAAQLAKK